MGVVYEGKHMGEFLCSEANGDRSREKGVLSSGQKVEDGQVLKLSGTEVVAAAGTVDSSGDSTESIVGIAYGNYDATSTGPKGEVDLPIAYIAREAVVKDTSLKLYTGSVTTPKTTAVKAALAALGIIIRPTV